MKLTRFDPPDSIDDFDSIPKQRDAWSEFLSVTLDREIQAVEADLGVGKSQFYNPIKIDTTDPKIEPPIN